MLACSVTPTYSAWSVTPMKSIGVSILMSKPIGCLIVWPLRILVGFVRAGDAVAHDPGIYRPTGVDVFLAEVGVALRVRLRFRLARPGECGGGLFLCCVLTFGFLLSRLPFFGSRQTLGAQ